MFLQLLELVVLVEGPSWFKVHTEGCLELQILSIIAVANDWRAWSQTEHLGVREDVKIAHGVLIGLGFLLHVPATAERRKPLAVPFVVA